MAGAGSRNFAKIRSQFFIAKIDSNSEALIAVAAAIDSSTLKSIAVATAIDFSTLRSIAVGMGLL